MSDSHDGEWLDEKTILEATGISHFLFVRYRTAGFFTTSNRSFPGQGKGSGPYSYSRATIDVIRWLRQHRKETHSDDERFWGLWFAGLVEIAKWVEDRIGRLEERVTSLQLKNPDILKRGAAAVARTPMKRTDPMRGIFRHLQQQTGRKLLVGWSVAIGIGEEPAISLYEPCSPLVPAFQKAAGSSFVPDSELEVERMSLQRLRDLVLHATAAERHQVQLDCKTLESLVKIAQAINWRTGGSSDTMHNVKGTDASSIHAFERLSTLWRSFDARAAVIPFLIFVRRSPEYASDLDQRLAAYAAELEARRSSKSCSEGAPEPRPDS